MRVQEYWIVDPDASVLTVYRLGTEGFERIGDFQGVSRYTSPLFPTLSGDVSAILVS